MSGAMGARCEPDRARLSRKGARGSQRRAEISDCRNAKGCCKVRVLCGFPCCRGADLRKARENREDAFRRSRRVRRIAKPRAEEAAPLVAFLGRSYGYKEISDYIVGERSVMSREEAETAIAEASTFVEQIEAWLSE